MTDCIVIGAGLSGLFTARELVEAGLSVSVVERRQPGTESSWAGGGILSPLYPWRYSKLVNDLATWSQAEYPGLARTLHQQSGVDPQWQRSGLLVLDGRDEEVNSWRYAQAPRLEKVDSRQLSGIEPSLNVTGDSAWWMPDIAQVRNPCLLDALVAYLQPRVKMYCDQGARQIIQAQGRVQAVELNNGTVLACDTVVVAGGAWSAQLMPADRWQPAVQPVRGQMLLLKTDPGALNRILLDGHRYIIPRRDGHVLVGSTLEYVGFDKSITGQAAAELRAFANQLVPGLVNAALHRHWSGLRPGAPSGIPYIGQHPALEGLFINAGHFRNGVVLGPASARLCADLVLGREPIVPTDGYGLGAARGASAA